MNPTLEHKSCSFKAYLMFSRVLNGKMLQLYGKCLDDREFMQGLLSNIIDVFIMIPVITDFFYLLFFFLTFQVDHLFKHRINSSVANASNYLKQFPSPLITIIAKFISFVSGGLAAILIIIGILDESLLEGHVSLSIMLILRFSK